MTKLSAVKKARLSSSDRVIAAGAPGAARSQPRGRTRSSATVATASATAAIGADHHCATAAANSPTPNATTSASGQPGRIAATARSPGRRANPGAASTPVSSSRGSTTAKAQRQPTVLASTAPMLGAISPETTHVAVSSASMRGRAAGGYPLAMAP